MTHGEDLGPRDAGLQGFTGAPRAPGAADVTPPLAAPNPPYCPPTPPRVLSQLLASGKAERSQHPIFSQGWCS